jgi:acetyl esterase/lipase
MLSYLYERLVGATLVALNLLAPLEVRVQTDLAYAAGSVHRADVYRPNAEGPHPVLVFLYGGGWRSGSKDDFAYVGAALARRGIVTVIPDYRHVPAASLSDILTDNAAAVAWTIAHAPALGGDPRRVVVAGHSSGAWAAAMLGLDATWLDHAGSSPDALAGIVGLSGPYTVSALTEPQDLQVFAGSDPGLQPINHAAGRHPAVALLTGVADLDVRPSGTFALASRLRAAAAEPEIHVYPGLGHAQTAWAISFPFSLQAPVADDIERFVDGARAGP